MLSVGQSHTAGTFLAFFLTEIAGVIISGAMLRGRVFPAAAGYVGMLGFGCLMVFETLAAFVSGLSTAVMLLAMVGGLLSLAWYILIARGLSRLERAG
ncbi:MAG: hypothetical protein VB089_06715, partial [Anaerolineaceae bacterium]|nr:hypothetical protein [Anaerolineaceae bacterium]